MVTINVGPEKQSQNLESEGGNKAAGVQLEMWLQTNMGRADGRHQNLNSASSMEVTWCLKGTPVIELSLGPVVWDQDEKSLEWVQEMAFGPF